MAQDSHALCTGAPLLFHYIQIGQDLEHVPVEGANLGSKLASHSFRSLQTDRPERGSTLSEVSQVDEVSFHCLVLQATFLDIDTRIIGRT